MATLILSTVGTALGGPVGGALGSLVGQAIDQSLFGPPARRGPRVGDLRVQTSTFGTPLPRIYGRMRVAGTVVWATDLREDETLTGSKGTSAAIQYSYSASFAVALSSRVAGRVGRIWADGKLLRGADGVLKSRVVFRFHDGSEDQAVDPLIAAIEGAGGAPAYRGLALAVFEDLALAEFGNRIPMLTFELIADEEPPRVAAIIADASGGVVEAGAGEATVVGYAALGSDRRSAIEPLVELWDGTFFDDGQRVRSLAAPGPVLVEAMRETGCTDDGAEAATVADRAQDPADELPSALTIDYHDPARDYQAGQMRASVGQGGRGLRRLDSAVTLSAEVAKALANDALARRWAGRDRITLRLSPAYLWLRPGALIRVPPIAGVYRAEQVTVEALVVIVEARRTAAPGAPLPADPGRAIADPDVTLGTTVPLLFDPPWSEGDMAGLLLAVGCTGAFRSTPVELSANGQPLGQMRIDRAATTGRAITALGGGQSALFDEVGAVDIQLTNAGAALFHADADALAMGANAALLGLEMIQFGRAEALGGGRFRLSRLLRGRRGTEWAMAEHLADEAFVLLDPGSTARVPIDRAMLGSLVEARSLGVADDPLNPPTATIVAGGEASRPLSPCHVRTVRGAGTATVTWIPRRAEALAWSAGSDAGNSLARFVVTATGEAGEVTREVVGPLLTLGQSDLDRIGSGKVTVAIAEVGPGGHSRAHIACCDA